MNKSHILVTGGAGYVGSHVSFILHQCGYRVIAVDALRHGQPWPTTGAHTITGDCGDTQLMEHIFQTYPIDTVIHCAASIEVSESIAQPISYYLNNVAVTLNLLQLMRHYQVKKIIFSSTCAVYGKPELIPMPESHPKNPLSPYGKSKAMVEQIIADAAHAHGLSYVIFRYFNAAGALAEYGLGECHVPETHVIPRLLHAAYSGAPFSINGTDYHTPDGTCVRDYTHVVDIAQAHRLALEYLAREGESVICNLGSGRGTSVRQLIAATEQILGLKIKVQYLPARPGDSPILIADTQLATALLGWEAQCSALPAIIQSAAAFKKGRGPIESVKASQPV